MKVIFRVDASTSMGTGHLMRCLTLAEGLRGRGVHTSFICREHPGHLLSLLRQRAMPATALPGAAAIDTTISEDYAVWLGATQAEDATQTIEAIGGEKADWLVVDSYGIDLEWERKLRPYVGKLMVIDDLANRLHDCDVLLDQNYSADGNLRYSGLVPSGCRLMVGPRYALLRPQYAAYRKTLRTHAGDVNRVLVFFGGSDLQNMTGLAVEALSQAGLCHLEVDVVIGANNPHHGELERQATRRPRTRIHRALPNLASLMAEADLAIGASGATTWERMCLGLPTVVVSMADNQRPASVALAEAHLICYAGHFSEINKDRLTHLLQELSGDPRRLAELSTKNQLQVDGLGASRIVEILHPSTIDKTYLRPAQQDDVVLYYNWANDPLVRENAIDTHPITWTTHQAWFAEKVHSASSRMLVLVAADLPVGQIRFDLSAEDAQIDYSLDEIVRGRGWGTRLVALGAKVMYEAGPVRLCAVVKSRNEASKSVFLQLGFTVAKDSSNKGCMFYLNPVRAVEQ